MIPCSVHRTEMLNQCQVRLQTIQATDKNTIGHLDCSDVKLTCKVDIGVMQTLTESKERLALLDNYG